MIVSLSNTSNYSIEFICEVCLQSYAIYKLNYQQNDIIKL